MSNTLPLLHSLEIPERRVSFLAGKQKEGRISSINTSNQRRAGLFCSVPTLRPEKKTTLPIVGALHLRSTAHAVHPLDPVERSTVA